MKTLKVYPVGVIDAPFTWDDVVGEDGKLVATISSVEDEDNIENNLKAGIYWDSDGLPDVVVTDRLITFQVMKNALKLLEADPQNEHKYQLVKKQWSEYHEGPWSEKSEEKPQRKLRRDEEFHAGKIRRMTPEKLALIHELDHIHFTTKKYSLA